MCIIAIKKAGVQYPTMETIKTICKNNPDGFTLVFKDFRDANRPQVYRTLNEQDFLDKYRELVGHHSYRDVNMFIHARIKTHGTKRLENCHGWQGLDLTFAHNGVLKIDNRDDMTDSETFFRDIFLPIYEHCGWEVANKAINAVIGTSKFVFMQDDGLIRYYGKYQESADKVLYSNDSYLSWRERYPSYNYTSYNSYNFNRTNTTPITETATTDKWDDFKKWLEKRK